MSPKKASAIRRSDSDEASVECIQDLRFRPPVICLQWFLSTIEVKFSHVRSLFLGISAEPSFGTARILFSSSFSSTSSSQSITSGRVSGDFTCCSACSILSTSKRILVLKDLKRVLYHPASLDIDFWNLYEVFHPNSCKHLTRSIQCHRHWSGEPASGVYDAVPARFASSAEESDPKASDSDENKNKSKKSKKQKKDESDVAPLGGKNKKDDNEDDESDELDGLDGLLQLDGDGKPKKRPASKKTSQQQKRPSSSKRSRKKDRYKQYSPYLAINFCYCSSFSVVTNIIKYHLGAGMHSVLSWDWRRWW